MAKGRGVPQVHYTVDFIEGVWKVGLGEKRFGPYSSLETAVAAASKAAHKAEEQGYEAFVNVNGPEDAEQDRDRDRHAA